MMIIKQFMYKVFPLLFVMIILMAFQCEESKAFNYYKDIVHLANGNIIEGKITTVAGDIIHVGTSKGLVKVLRVQLINSRDTITVGWFPWSKKILVGNVYHVTPGVLEIETPDGRHHIHKRKIRSIVLGQPVNQPNYNVNGVP